MQIPHATVKQLKAALANLPPGLDEAEVKIWLPGSHISLSPFVLVRSDKRVLIEGNVDPGSALEWA